MHGIPQTPACLDIDLFNPSALLLTCMIFTAEMLLTDAFSAFRYGRRVRQGGRPAVTFFDARGKLGVETGAGNRASLTFGSDKARCLAQEAPDAWLCL